MTDADETVSEIRQEKKEALKPRDSTGETTPKLYRNYTETRRSN
jgi:hypothetical protein